jgi:hypothetical protein
MNSDRPNSNTGSIRANLLSGIGNRGVAIGEKLYGTHQITRGSSEHLPNSGLGSLSMRKNSYNINASDGYEDEDESDEDNHHIYKTIELTATNTTIIPASKM